MGTAYLADQLGMDRLAVVKVLHPHLVGDSHWVERFYREAKVASKLSHPNSITLYNVGRTEEGYVFIAMEYVDGKSLAKIIEEDAPLPPERAVKIAVQICGALQEAHEFGIVHRDLKPDNILITKRGKREQAKVLDFGIAKVRGSGPDEPQLTATGMVFGTPAYMSPEQFAGGDLDGRSDLYSLGIILYEMLAGKRPFIANTPIAYFRMHQEEPPPPIKITNPRVEVPPALEAVVMKALEKDRTRRFDDAEAMASALKTATEASAGAGPSKPKGEALERDDSVAAWLDRLAPGANRRRDATATPPIRPSSMTPPAGGRSRPPSALPQESGEPKTPSDDFEARLLSATEFLSGGVPEIDQARVDEDEVGVIVDEPPSSKSGMFPQVEGPSILKRPLTIPPGDSSGVGLEELEALAAVDEEISSPTPASRQGVALAPLAEAAGVRDEERTVSSRMAANKAIAPTRTATGPRQAPKRIPTVPPRSVKESGVPGEIPRVQRSRIPSRHTLPSVEAPQRKEPQQAPPPPSTMKRRAVPKPPSEPSGGSGRLIAILGGLVLLGVSAAGLFMWHPSWLSMLSGEPQGGPLTDTAPSKADGPDPRRRFQKSRLIRIPGGKFVMGDPEVPNARPHQVTLSPFYIDRYEVTNAQYQECVVAKQCLPSYFSSQERFGGPNKPVVGVTYPDAVNYCRWRGLRLPTEAEWERAARGPEGWRWPWGDEFKPGYANVAGVEDGASASAPVASFAKGATKEGLFHMAGNVAEWVADSYGAAKHYPRKATRDPRKEGKDGKAWVRGGSFVSEPEKTRSTLRGERLPRDAKRFYVGFRCASDAPKPKSPGQ